jgi:hypothetical protein
MARWLHAESPEAEAKVLVTLAVLSTFQLPISWLKAVVDWNAPHMLETDAVFHAPMFRLKAGFR